MSSTRINEQNPKIVSKTEDFGFSAKFLSKLSFGDEFDCSETMWIHLDLFHVLKTKFQSIEVWMMFSNEFFQRSSAI